MVRVWSERAKADWKNRPSAAILELMEQLPVPKALSPFVRSMCWVDETPIDGRYRRLPDCEAELLVQFGTTRLAAIFAGTRTRSFEKPLTESGSALLVRFRAAGAYAFVSGPMSELTDQLLPLEELWGQDARDSLFEARGPQSVAERAASALQGLLQTAQAREPSSVPAVRRAVRLVQQAEVLPRVRELAEQLGLSERQLRRGFDDVVGVSPKRFLRIARFRRALRSARAAGRVDWARIAEQHGYFDQAHLIADFREMTGVTPSRFVG
jgi:AraC-like DNA-binding protein